MAIGNQIKRLREGKKLSQKSLADALGVHRVTVARWETNERAPSFPEMENIAKALSTDVIGLIGENRPIEEVRKELGDGPLNELSHGALSEIQERLSKVEDRVGLKFEAISPAPVRSYLNTRTDYPVYTPVSQNKARPRPIPMISGLAAGPGREIEPCNEYYWFREYVPKDSMAVRIHGTSMLKTIRDGEVIVVEMINDGKGVELSELMRGEPKTPYRTLRQHVRNDEIWMVSIGREEPTLKRVSVFDPDGDWFLTITADNPYAKGFPRPIRGSDSISFLGKMIGYVREPEED